MGLKRKASGSDHGGEQNQAKRPKNGEAVAAHSPDIVDSGATVQQENGGLNKSEGAALRKARRRKRQSVDEEEARIAEVHVEDERPQDETGKTKTGKEQGKVSFKKETDSKPSYVARTDEIRDDNEMRRERKRQKKERRKQRRVDTETSNPLVDAEEVQLTEDHQEEKQRRKTDKELRQHAANAAATMDTPNHAGQETMGKDEKEKAERRRNRKEQKRQLAKAIAVPSRPDPTIGDSSAKSDRTSKEQEKHVTKGASDVATSNVPMPVDSRSVERRGQNTGAADVVMNETKGATTRQDKAKKHRRSAANRDTVLEKKGKRNSHAKRSDKSDHLVPMDMPEPTKWKVSDVIGGRMLDIDPVFSSDEKHFLVAYGGSVIAYATATSLPVRQLRMKDGDRITSMCLCPIHESRIYIAALSGRIEFWDWSQELKIHSWRLNPGVRQLAAVKHSQHEDQTLVYITHQTDTSSYLSVQNLDNSNAEGAEDHPLFSHNQQISSLQIVDKGRVIALTSGNQLILGHRSSSESAAWNELAYVWRITTCLEWISSVDVRFRDFEQGQNQQRKRGIPSIDVVVGGLKGAIHVYDDLLNKLMLQERPTKDGRRENLKSQRLHWHRTAVLAVKWSQDGNYVISGGGETVLILWQMETSKKDTLPHLGAPIESIVVSPSGSSYGIRLADNSAMILSTMEMKPTFSVCGVQAPTETPSGQALPFVPTVDTKTRHSDSKQRLSLAACISPTRPGQLLFAVPSLVSSRAPGLPAQSASYLQTFDAASASQLSRQALTRTKATDLSMGPESNTIQEPNVGHIATSHDGQWLASVDEWTPPTRDVAPLAFNSDREIEEQTFRQEVYLRVWSWNGETDNWELNSRVDNPHASDSGDAYAGARVLALAADPTSTGFATFGEDGYVKAWKPTIRYRNGVSVKDKDGRELTTWHCRFTTFVQSPDHNALNKKPAAKMAYSADGSVIVVGLQTSVPSPVYLLDGLTGAMESVQTGLYSGVLLGLGILDKYLVIVSNELIVWDLVTDQLLYGIDLELSKVDAFQLTAYSHLAINAQHHTFAVAVPQLKNRKDNVNVVTRIAIFSTAGMEPSLVTSLPNTTTALLPAVGRKGYYIVDTAAEVRTLFPSQPLPVVPTQVPAIIPKSQTALDGFFGTASKEKKLRKLLKNTNENTQQPQLDEGQSVHVTVERLAEVFDQGPSYALPPVSDLFEQVAALFIGHTTPAAA